MKQKSILAILAILALAILSVLGMLLAEVFSGTSKSQPEAVGTAENPNHGDIMFTAMMIPHHQQAIEMANIVATNPQVDPQVLQLAEQIKSAQDPEITQMKQWLVDWKAGSYSEMDHTGHMTGMLDDQAMAQLRAADGHEAGRLFLEGMIAHHNGAVQMALNELRSGQLEKVKDLANAIVTAQNQEIAQMNTMLGITPLPKEATAILNAAGFSATTAVDLVNQLEATPEHLRPKTLMASVQPTQVVLSDTTSGTKVSVPLPEDKYYLSVAPYRNQTHDCHNHSLTTCKGEMGNESFKVTVTDSAGTTLSNEEKLAADNGFVGLWLPRGFKGNVTLADATGSATTSIDTAAPDAPTCITTAKLS